MKGHLTGYMEFAKAYASLGGAVQDQLDELIENADYADGLNPNAVALIKERLGGLSADLDEVIGLWEQGHLAET